MAMLHFFGGEKGGTGKSLVARTAAQYHLDRGIEFSLFDADNCVADVKRTYQSIGCGSVIFSEKEERQDEPNCLYSEAIDKTTLVNLPPQVGIPLKDWLERNNVLKVAKKYGVEITYWFVCNGEPGSIRLLDEHLSYFQSSINHVFVKNLMHGNTWEYLDEDQSLQPKIKDYKVKVIDFPQFLGQRFLDKIIAKGLTFAEARECQEFHSLNRSQMTAALEQAYQEFDKAQAFNKDVNA